MDKRSCGIAAIAVIFLIFALIFYKVEKDEFECDAFMDSCIHFCSNDAEKYPDSLVKSITSLTDSPWESHWIYESSYEEQKRVLRGNLKCLNTITYKSSELNTSLEIFEENPELLFSLNSPEKYCIEFLSEIDGEKEDEIRPWILHKCHVNQTAKRIFHGFGKLNIKADLNEIK